jgi:hypothetical protein
VPQQSGSRTECKNTSQAAKGEAPAAKDRGLNGQKAGRLEARDYLPSEFKLKAEALAWPPRSVAKDHHAALAARGVIGDRKSLLLSHPFLQAKYDFPRAPQCEGNGVSKDFSLRHAPVEHENDGASRYILYPWARGRPSDLSGRPRRGPSFQLFLSGQLRPMLRLATKSAAATKSLNVIGCLPWRRRGGRPHCRYGLNSSSVSK